MPASVRPEWARRDRRQPFSSRPGGPGPQRRRDRHLGEGAQDRHRPGRPQVGGRPDRRVMLLFLDAQAQHGVYLGAITACDRADDAAIAHEAPARSPRFSRVRKDGLAVLREIDEAFTRILGWQPEEVLGTRTRDLIHPDDEALAVDNWMEVLASPGSGAQDQAPPPPPRRLLGLDGGHEPQPAGGPRAPLRRGGDGGHLRGDGHPGGLRAREQLLDRLAETLPLGLLQVDSDARVDLHERPPALHSWHLAGEHRREQLSTVVDEDPTWSPRRSPGCSQTASTATSRFVFAPRRERTSSCATAP